MADVAAYVFSNDALASLQRRDGEVAQMVIQKAEKLCMEYDVSELTHINGVIYSIL